ncbi:MAG: hypothetical protein RQ966_19645 [Acetobacteraceae bacterium]|nr:hypothetical protein [Acetobacteraceae bacterium]
MAQTITTRRGVILGLAGLSGCTLVDQRTFDPTAGLPPQRPKPPVPPPPLAPPDPGRPPLLSIRLPAADLRTIVARAVASARARKPDVRFEVVEITPGTSAGPEAAEIARIIVAQGVPPNRVSLSARPVPGVAHEVRVFVH